MNEDYALEISRRNLARRVTELDEQLSAAQAQIGSEQERAVHWYGEFLCCKEERDRARREAKGVRSVLGLYVDSSEEVIDEVRRLKEQRDELRLNHEELRGERDALEGIVADLTRQLVEAKRNKEQPMKPINSLQVSPVREWEVTYFSPPTQQDGWGWPQRAIKKHYIKGGVSLCGRHHLAGHYIWTTTDDKFPDMQCKECQKRLWTREEQSNGS